MANDYNRLTVAGQDYKVAWKSVESGKTDSVLIDRLFDELPNDLTFEDNSTNPVSFSNYQGQTILPIIGREHEEVHQIYPVQTKQDSTGNIVKKYAGKLNVITYDKKEIEVVLVPINGSMIITEGQRSLIENGLNEIYKPAVTSFSLEYTNPVQIEDFDGILEWEDSGLLHAYDDQMRDLINMAFEEIDYSYEKYYIFLVNESACGCIKGFMPQNRQVGFIVTSPHSGTTDLTRTIAHELGHGVFNLNHTYADYPDLNAGATDNLMDRGDGTKLHKYQWDFVQNPVFNITLFDSDEDGASVETPPIVGTAYVYYAGLGNYIATGILGHTSAGYLGEFDPNSTVLYAPMSGNSSFREDRIGGDGYPYNGVSEEDTIKDYLDTAEDVERYHYTLPSDVMENFATLLEGQTRNPSSAEGLWCTIQVYYSFYRAFQSSPRYTNDEAEIEASKIIYYTLPEQLTRSEIIETGSSRYDKFYKRDDGTYYMKSFFHDSDTNSWIEQQSDF